MQVTLPFVGRIVPKCLVSELLLIHSLAGPYVVQNDFSFVAIMASRSLPGKYVSIDVECVATGRRHDARSVALVAIVDQDERVLLMKKVKPSETIVSFLTPLTGLREGDLEDGEQLSSVLEEVKRLLGPDVVLVGQGVKNDVNWLNLREGEDYSSTVELGELFKTYNPRFRNYNYFSLSHEANTLLHSGIYLYTAIYVRVRARLLLASA